MEKRETLRPFTVDVLNGDGEFTASEQAPTLTLARVAAARFWCSPDLTLWDADRIVIRDFNGKTVQTTRTLLR